MKQITLKLTVEEREEIERLRLDYCKSVDKVVTMTDFIKVRIGLIKT